MPPLRTRAPLDVDLEDKLIFGLTPVRFGYLAIGALAAYVLAAHSGLAGGLRMPGAVVLLGAAAAIAWVRWRGRPLDAWLLDLAIYARRNLEVQVDAGTLRRIRLPRPRVWRPRLRARPPGRRVPTITVVGAAPGAGATTVAVELGAALALKGRRVALSQPAGAGDAPARLGLAGPGIHLGSGLRVVEADAPVAADCVVLDLGATESQRRADLALVVAGRGGSTPAARQRVRSSAHVAVVVNRDRDDHVAPSGADVAAAVPDDPAVPAAQQQGEPVILRFPGSRAARAFRLLADEVDPGTPSPWPDGDSDPPLAG